MAKTKSQIIHYVLYGMLGLGILAVMSYFFVIRPLQIRTQKQNFAKAEVALTDLEKQIEVKIGKPDAIKKDRSCGYASRLNERGPRGCSIQIASAYKVIDSSGANTLQESINQILLLNLNIVSISYSSNKPFTPLISDRQAQRFNYDFRLPNNPVGCSIQLVYAKHDNKSLVLTTSIGSDVTSIELACGGSAMAEFFPVNNN